MKHQTLHRLSLDERRFGSPLDPVLCGVAQGLARLFPPVENADPDGEEREPGRSEPRKDATAFTETPSRT